MANLDIIEVLYFSLGYQAARKHSDTTWNMRRC